jgi:hypothetical protein
MSSMNRKKMSALFTDKEIDSERAFEVRVRSIKTNESKSFSLSIKRGINESGMLGTEELKEFFEDAWIKEKKKHVKK